MEKSDILNQLQNGKNEEAYKLLLELESESAESSLLYSWYDDFMELLHHKSVYVRIRGFRLCAAQVKWDTEHKTENSLGELLSMLDDDKPIAVRQCLEALHQVLLYKPELSSLIDEKLLALDLSKYKDTMRPLIKKDIAELRSLFL